MKILYFAWLREKIGTAEEVLTVPSEVRNVAELVAWLKLRSAGHDAAFQNERLVRCAVDQEFASLDAPVLGAREIAFFPPVTGG
jgi:molybdopterin synthase sulfur carrier subunit